MLPNRIYLTEQELLDTITGEKMVSCNEPYEDMAEEYINLKQIWHDTSEEPKKNKYILIEVVNTLNPGDIEYYVEYSDNWMITAMKTGFKYRWVYISDLLPKGGGE